MGRQVRLALGVAVSLGAAAWFASGVSWGELGVALSGVKPGWVALAALLLLGEFAIRAVRWLVLLRPLGARARLMDLWAATVIGAAANTLLPLRAGEVAKPLVAQRRTGYPLASVVATAVMERVFDLFGMLSVLVLMVLSLPATAEADHELVYNLKLYGGLFGAAAMTCMAIFFGLATRPYSARAAFARIAGLGPRPAANFALLLFDGFVAGLGTTRDLRGLLSSGLLSVAMWVNGAVAIFCLFQAFSMPLPFGAACFTAVAIALTVALPQAPGFIGVFHVAMEKTMLLWGQSSAAAQGFAIVFWAVSFLPVTLFGLLAMWREGIHMSDLRLGPAPPTPAPAPAQEG